MGINTFGSLGLEVVGTQITNNIISGNPQGGIVLNDFTNNSIIQNNSIGLDITGTDPIPNSVGLAIQADTGGPNSPCTGNIIGSAGAGNIISGNTANGIMLMTDVLNTIIQDGTNFSGNTTAPGIGGAAAGSSGGNGSSLGEDIFIQSGGSVTFQVANALALSNPIEGAGLLAEATSPGVIKAGIGMVNMTGANTYFGGTLIQSGIVNLNGSVAGDVNIEAGGTLSGNATVNGNIYNNGTISPGNSIGEIFTTDLYLYPTSVYNVEVNSAGASDIIIASGSAQIGGGVVVTPDDLNFTAPLTYTIISASGGVTGAFSSLTSSVPSLMSLIYNPLTVQLTYLPLDAIGLTCNALNVAHCFTTLTGADVTTVNNALLALSFEDIQAAFEQMSPAQFSGPTEVLLVDDILVRSTYTKHVQKFCSDKDRHLRRPVSLWIDEIAQYQNQRNPFGFNDTTLGVTVGIDYCIHNWIVGLAFSFTKDYFRWKHCAGKATMDSYYAGLYSRWDCDRFYLNAAFLGAFNNYRTARQLNFGAIDRRAYSQHKGKGWLAHLGFGYLACPSYFQCIPYVNLDYALQHENGFTEAGAGSLDLQVKKKNAMLFQGEAGVSVSTNYQACKGIFTPMLTLAYINQTPCSNKNYCASFADSCCVFAGRGGDYKRNLFVPRLAFTYQDLRDRVGAAIYYDGQVGTTYWAQDVVLEITFRF